MTDHRPTVTKHHWLISLALMTLLGGMELRAQPSISTNAAGALILTGHFGDVNDDGQVNVLDLVHLSSHLSGERWLTGDATNRADINVDGVIGAADQRILAALIAARFIQAEEDFDGDELSNAEEQRLGTRPIEADSDHDGSIDGWEVAEGTNPLDPLSKVNLTIVARPRVAVLHPLIQEDDPSQRGLLLARPPVKVLNP